MPYKSPFAIHIVEYMKKKREKKSMELITELERMGMEMKMIPLIATVSVYCGE